MFVILQKPTETRIAIPDVEEYDITQQFVWLGDLRFIFDDFPDVSYDVVQTVSTSVSATGHSSCSRKR